MARAFHVEPLRLNLAITMFLLASAVFLPISGWVADKFGAKRIFMIAMVLFALSFWYARRAWRSASAA